MSTAESLLTPIPRAAGRKCAAQHFGAWSIEPRWFSQAVASIRAGTWKPKAAWDDEEDEGDDEGTGYTVKDGIAIVCIDGQMTKRGSSWGGCSTVAVRQALRNAAADWQVKGVILHVCSPGGTVSGTADLADDVNGVRDGRFNNGRGKPVYAFVADIGCSAAYWVASQCQAVYCNVTAIVGSIGTYTVLEDDTGAQEQYGITYRVVSTGPYKGLGADGKVTDELVADVQREINELNQPFLAAVKAGRGNRIPDLAAVADGRAYAGEQARQLGLVDTVSSFDDAFAAISKEVGTMPITAQQFSAHAAENPTAAEVQALVQQGYDKARAEFAPKAATATELDAAFPGEQAFCFEQLKAGATMATAATAYGAKLRADVAAKDKQMADQATAHKAELAEKDKAVEKARFEAGGQRPIGTGNAKAGDAGAGNAADPDLPIEKQAEADYDADPKAQADFEKACGGDKTRAKAAYVKYRVNTAAGRVRTGRQSA